MSRVVRFRGNLNLAGLAQGGTISYELTIALYTSLAAANER
jgi:hypothetical protein